MTDEELKQLVASLAISQKELHLAQQETDRQLKETDQRQKETDRQLRETDRQQKETDRQLKETDRQLRKQLKELGVQIGGLGNKFGYFTEGMALPSMEKLLYRKFGMDVVAARVKSRITGEDLEIDVLAYSNGERNTAFVVEIKSLLREREIQQVLNILKKFPQAFPEHANKALYGIIAAVDIPTEMRQRILEEGLYLARIHDEHFQLQVPKDFKPRRFN